MPSCAVIVGEAWRGVCCSSIVSQELLVSSAIRLRNPRWMRVSAELKHPGACLSTRLTFIRDAEGKKQTGTPAAAAEMLAEKAPVPSYIDIFQDRKCWQGILIQLAALGGFLVLQALSHDPALAGEITQAQPGGSSIIGSIDEIKSGFTLAFLLIFFSELGDKTFFIAAILATRKSNLAVFTGTFGALVTMTLISVTLGRAFHYIDGILPFRLGSIEIPLDDLAAVVLLIYFGISTLVDAASMEGSKAEEEQQEAELAVAGVGGGSSLTSNVVIATFALVFVAEWGDKSFFSTIALAAASSPAGVVAGAIAGHGAATLLAVLGGSFLGNYISEKVIAYIGGTLFLVFAGETLYEIITGKK